MAQRIAAVIFDFDGVLADTESVHCTAFQAVAAEIGAPLTRADYYRWYLGLPDRDCLAAVCAAAGRPADDAALAALVARKRAHYARLARGAALYPGVAAALRRLAAAFPLAIASGAFRDEIEPLLAHAGVRSLFHAVVGAEDVRAGKPAPEPFLCALQALNRAAHTRLSPGDCLVVEDSPRGIAAARAAGMRCIAVATSHPHAALRAADAIVSDVCALRPGERR